MASISIKRVLLGSAAGILATATAQAADLPVKKAAAVQYVRVCPAYGAGFFEVPGTDACVKLIGYLKFGAGYHPSQLAYDGRAAVITEKSSAENVGWQFSARPGFDFRVPTEWGTARWVTQWRIDLRQGLLERVSPRDPADATDQLGANRPSMQRAYVEWAGFTLGRQGSNFVYFDQDDNTSAAGGSPKTTVFMLSYAAVLGGGLKATIGLEDSESWAAGNTRNRKTPAGFGIPANTSISAFSPGPSRMYDVVASLSTEQTWGGAKISGAAHQNSVIATGSNGIDCQYDPAPAVAGSCPVVINTGWAALAGVTIKLPALGEKDQLLLETSYADGAIAYAGIGGGGDSRPWSFERNGQWSGGLLRRDFDAHAINNGDGSFRLENEKAHSVLGQLRHYWNPNLRSNLTVANSWIRPGDITRATLLTNGGLGNAEVFDAALNLIWGSSKKGFGEIGVEVLYKKVRQDLPGASTLPLGIEQNPSVWSIATAISRTF